MQKKCGIETPSYLSPKSWTTFGQLFSELESQRQTKTPPPPKKRKIINKMRRCSTLTKIQYTVSKCRR